MSEGSANPVWRRLRLGGEPQSSTKFRAQISDVLFDHRAVYGGLTQFLLGLGSGEEHNPRRGDRSLNRPCRTDPVQTRHRDVHHNDVRTHLVRDPDGHVPIGCLLNDHRHVPQQRDHKGAETLVVINNQRPHSHDPRVDPLPSDTSNYVQVMSPRRTAGV
jgi:hypothetical protein